VAYTYNGLGMLTTEYQDHAAAAGPGDPSVQYDPDDTAPGGEYTDGMRLKRLRYPNGRYVHCTCGDGDANDVLSRVAAIRNDNAGSPGATVFAAYTYDGAGRVGSGR